MTQVSGSKTCTKCGRTLLRSDFHQDRQKRDGLCPQCKQCKTAASSAYHASHREICNEKKALRYQEQREVINKQRRAHPEVSGRGRWNKLHPAHVDFGASSRKSFGESSFNRLVRQYKASARRRGIEFLLSQEAFRALTSANCAYCGVSPQQKIQDKTAHGFYTYNGIDRVDSKLGYVESNCVTACGVCNRAKNSMSLEEWEAWMRRLVEHRKSLVK